MKTIWKVQGILIALLLIAACGGGDAEPAAEEPTATPIPTVTPSPTPVPTEPAAEQPESPLGQPDSPLDQPDSPLALPDEGPFDDPFAYCAAVIDIEAPDARYTGPDAPEAIAQGLRDTFDTPDTPLSYYQDAMVWRCMDGFVYACSVGANLPCSEQADPRDEPTEAIELYCEENPDSDFIPMVVTGRATIFQWSCIDGEPHAGEPVMEIDAQGFLADIWHLIEPEDAEQD